MLRGIFVLLAALLMCALAFGAYRWRATMPTERLLSKAGGEMDWLRMEFNLTDAQFAKIKAMHEAYASKCGLMCQKISEANARVGQLVKANKNMTLETESALKDAWAAQGECRQAMLAHVYAVSAEMSPEAGARHLRMMTPRIIEPGLDHSAVVSREAK